MRARRHGKQTRHVKAVSKQTGSEMIQLSLCQLPTAHPLGWHRGCRPAPQPAPCPCHQAPPDPAGASNNRESVGVGIQALFTGYKYTAHADCWLPQPSCLPVWLPSNQAGGLSSHSKHTLSHTPAKNPSKRQQHLSSRHAPESQSCGAAPPPG
jgi:hypothetical protein